MHSIHAYKARIHAYKAGTETLHSCEQGMHGMECNEIERIDIHYNKMMLEKWIFILNNQFFLCNEIKNFDLQK